MTKSALVTRDIDVLQDVARVNRLTVNITVTTMDRKLARILEPRAPRPDLRIQAIGENCGRPESAPEYCARR